MSANGLHVGSRTAGYRPSLSSARAWAWSLWDEDAWFTRADIMWMRRDPRVSLGLRILYAPVLAARVQVRANSLEVQRFVEATLRRFRQHDLPKALHMLDWGEAGGEALYEQDERGRWQWAGLKEIHVDDIRPLRARGKLWGLRIMSVPGKSQGVDLPLPGSIWFVNDPQPGDEFYGQSRLAGPWKPWKEKRGKHGAIDTRRNWMVRNAFTGAMMRYPEGVTEVAPGKFVHNQEIAREIVEKAETGHVEALPGTYDPETGKFL
jgi:hypothetical protein